MKKKNFFALLAQTGLAFAAALLISSGLASCSKDKNKNKMEDGVIYMATKFATENEIELCIGKDDKSIDVMGAEKTGSETTEGEWLKIKYKLTAQELAVKGDFTKFTCNNCGLNYLYVGKKKELTKLDCSQNKLTRLDLSQNKQLTHITCERNLISKDENFILPNESVSGGKIYFKVSEDALNQRLSQKKVTDIKALGWEIYNYVISWEDYKGED